MAGQAIHVNVHPQEGGETTMSRCLLASLHCVLFGSSSLTNLYSSRSFCEPVQAGIFPGPQKFSEQQGLPASGCCLSFAVLFDRSLVVLTLGGAGIFGARSTGLPMLYSSAGLVVAPRCADRYGGSGSDWLADAAGTVKSIRIASSLMASGTFAVQTSAPH